MKNLGRGKARRKKPKTVVVQNLAGENWDSPWGTIRRVVKRYPLAHCHGTQPVGEALSARREILARVALDDTMLETPIDGMLFLDTETTGLAGGTGTVAFLIGLGYFEAGEFVLEQLLLPRLGEEAPMLAYVAERIRLASMLVTYNGKSYDMPLIRNRWVLNRVKAADEIPHLDLLHCCRRVYGTMLEQMRLVNMEEEVLSFEREDDVPGFMIPGIFFQFLKDGEGLSLDPILEHNEYDILALAAMVGLLNNDLESPTADKDPRLTLAVARLQMRAKDRAASLQWLSHLTGADSPLETMLDGCLLGAKILQKEKSWQAARELLDEGLAFVGKDLEQAQRLSEVHLMLAKLCEHKLGALNQALKHAKAAELAEGEAGSLKRVERVERKIAKEQEAPACAS
ncbi:MAG: ribonuclease H-like domain-containing protein [Deltaproteobacteria bacterium]|nr:ribonuclease H-like domain-containing protein [Deltaproteobacteria bacterium]